MKSIRKLLAVGTASVVSLALVAAPASATRPQDRDYAYYAEIDCGSGPIDVGSGEDLWSSQVDLESGKKYTPVAWDVAGVAPNGEEFVVQESRKGALHKHAVDCTYDDGVARGTLTVKKA